MRTAVLARMRTHSQDTNHTHLAGFLFCALATACGGPENSEEGWTDLDPGTSSGSDQGPAEASGENKPSGPTLVNYEIPADFPQLTARYKTHAVITFHAYTMTEADWGSPNSLAWNENERRFQVDFRSTTGGQLVVDVDQIEPGTYESGFYSKVRIDHFAHPYDTEDWRSQASVTITGSNVRALWGTVDGTVCLIEARGNCSELTARFSAALE